MPPPSQELVNLLLTGAAVSNVFNGDIELGGKDSDKVSPLHAYFLCSHHGMPVWARMLGTSAS